MFYNVLKKIQYIVSEQIMQIPLMMGYCHLQSLGFRVFGRGYEFCFVCNGAILNLLSCVLLLCQHVSFLVSFLFL